MAFLHRNPLLCTTSCRSQGGGDGHLAPGGHGHTRWSREGWWRGWKRGLRVGIRDEVSCPAVVTSLVSLTPRRQSRKADVKKNES